MADGQQNQGNQGYGNQFFLKEQASRMLNAIQKGYNDNFPNQESTSNAQSGNQQVVATLYMNQQQQQPQQVVQHPQQNQVSTLPGQVQVQQQQLQSQLQQVQQAQNQFQQIQQIAQMQQQFQQQYTSANDGTSNVNVVLASPVFCPMRRGRKPVDKRKRRRHTWVKRPTTAYLYFVSKYRETLKEAGEVVPKAKIITQACAEKWRNMNDEEKEPFLELSRRDRERWVKDKALEKKPRDPNRPKRPPSAYFLFLADFRKTYPNKADPAKEITKKAGEAWNNLSDQEKNPYYSQAQVIRSKWEEDLEKYRLSTGADKNSSVNRSSSIDSNSTQLNLNSDASPREGDLADLNPSMLQESAMLGMTSGQTYGDGQNQATTSSDVDAMTSSGLTYGYNHTEKQESSVGFPGR